MLHLVSPFIKIYKALYLFLFDATRDYGISLVLLSFVTFLLLLPFNKKAQQLQHKERKIQAVIAPQIEKIKKNYSGQEQYEKLKRLYHRYAYHPLYAVRSVIGVLLQLPFLATAYYMLSGLPDIQGVSWGVIQNLGKPDQLLGGINLLPFIMTLVTIAYAFVMPNISKRERLQSVIIGLIFLVLLYNAPSALLIFWTSNLLWSLLFSVFEEKLQRIGSYVKKNELAFHIIIALSLTVGLLVPTEIFIRNASQLWFDLKDILKYFLLDTAKFFSILLLLYIICWRKKIRSTYLSVLLGVLFGVFLQSYIIGVDYGTFDGHEIRWETYTWTSIINTFIWLFCLGETFIFFKRAKFNEIKISKFVKPVSFCIIVIQCAVLLLTLKNHPIKKNVILEDGKAGILTAKDLFSVSSRDNTIIFLIDAFDASLFEEIQKKNPEVITDFKDFTFYPDTISSFGFTDFSISEILTGKLYDPATRYSVYLHEAWENNPYYYLLKERNYSIYLYTNGLFIDKNAPVDNLVIEKAVIKDEVAEQFGELVKFRVAPHFIKRLYYHYNPGIKNPTVFNSEIKPYDGINDKDRVFYLSLKKESLKLTEKNAFKFYYLSGVHPPYEYDENVELLSNGIRGTAYKQALGSLKIVREYISQMKLHGIYNNAAFVILADHGYHYRLGNRPIFLVKMPGVNHNHLMVSERPTKVSEMMPLLFNSHNLLGALDQASEQKNKNRYYYYEKLDDRGQFIKYQVLSPAGNISSWVALGEVEKKANNDRKYKIGDKIDFSYYGDSFKYKLNGWGDREEWFGSVIEKPEAELLLNIDDIPEKKDRFEIQIMGHPLLHFDNELLYRDLKLYVNDNFVGSYRFITNTEKQISFDVSSEIIRQRKVTLRITLSSNKTGFSFNADGTKDLDGQSFQVNAIVIK